MIYEKWKKHPILAMSLGSFLGAMTNTILVLGGIYLFFGNQYASALGMDIFKIDALSSHNHCDNWFIRSYCWNNYFCYCFTYFNSN